MPKIIFKESTLNDQASIIKYNHRDVYYLRIRKEKKSYTNLSLNTTNLDDARKSALTVFLENHTKPSRHRQSKYLFVTACEKFLEKKQERVDIGRLKAGSYDSYHQRIYQRIIPFAKATGIIKVSDIEKDSWRDKYFTYYRKVKTKGKWNKESDGLNISTINSDITTVNELLKWMIDEEFIDPRNVRLAAAEKDNRDMRDEANPAFFPEDWEKFKTALYQWETDIGSSGAELKYSWNNYIDEERAWKKKWLKHYVLFQFGLGSRPSETRNILVRDISFKTLDNGQKKGIVYIRPENKRGKRTAIMNGHTLAKLQQHLNKGIKIRNMQCASFNKMIDEKYRDTPIEKLCKRFKRINPDTRMWDEHPPVSPDDSLLMNPFRANDKVKHFTVQTIDNWYKEVLSRCDLTDNFTIYSLRSTHITHAILRGVREGTSASSIKVLVADNCGTSEAELNRTYRRLNNLLNIDLLGFHQDSKLSIPVDVEYKDEDDSL